MASTLPALCCALAALLIWTTLGLPVTKRIFDAPLALPCAPVAGWAIHNVIAVPVFFLVPWSAISIVAVLLLALALSIGLSRIGHSSTALRADASPAAGLFASTGIAPIAWLLSVAVALASAAAVLPKQVGDAVILSDPIFDHSKVAIIDDMARLGLPPGNPFFAHDGSNGQLAYYYLWHFSTAQLTRLLGISGWSADAGMTFFSAFTSLTLMMALARRYSGRADAAMAVAVIATSCSGRLLIGWIVGDDAIEQFMPAPGGLGGWMFQSSWVPQHLISTSCLLLALLIMTRLSDLPARIGVVVLALVAAASFESSTWIGGIVFALICIPVVPMLLAATAAGQRLGVLLQLLGAGALTAALAAPFLVSEMASAALRHAGSPVAWRLPVVISAATPAGSPGLVDVLGFWLLLLPLELPGVYLCGIAVIGVLLFQVRLKWQPEAKLLAVATVVALLASWLLVSTLADNNDLSWRAMLMASTGLIVFAAVGVSSWIASGRIVAIGLALLCFAIGVPESMMQIERNLNGDDQPDGVAFAHMPAMWQAVRAVTGSTERIANNPRSLEKLTPWPVNIGWSLLAQRRSCYAGWELTQVYSAVPHLRLWQIDEQFKRVFAGTGSPQDVSDLAVQFDCSVAVLTKDDGAWGNDPFRGSSSFDLVNEMPGEWRIYHRKPSIEPDPKSGATPALR